MEGSCIVKVKVLITTVDYYSCTFVTTLLIGLFGSVDDPTHQPQKVLILVDGSLSAFILEMVLLE